MVEEMTVGEITNSYRLAKCKSKQIGILAELCCCTQREIKDILIAQGLIKAPKQKEKKGDEKVPGSVIEALEKEMVSIAEQIDALEARLAEIKGYLDKQRG